MCDVICWKCKLVLTSIFFLHYADNSALMNPLEFCCKGECSQNSCGSVDDNGEKKYSLCEKPEVSFFWDKVHPSQNGWNAVYKQLQSSLGQLIDKN